MTELNESARQALGIAIQILEELPELHRPDSNIEHMRQMLRPHQLSDRDEIILQEAIATALVFRIKSALSATPPERFQFMWRNPFLPPRSSTVKGSQSPTFPNNSANRATFIAIRRASFRARATPPGSRVTCHLGVDGSTLESTASSPFGNSNNLTYLGGIALQLELGGGRQF
jgi:hypothetical protein